MLSIPLTAQTILNENTGKVETTPERIKNAARIMKDWHRMDSVLQVREKQLLDAQRLVDSLKVRLAVETQLKLEYLAQRDQRDDQITELASQEIDIYKGLSRGLHLDTYFRSQVYNLDTLQPSLPATLGANLNFSWSRNTIGISIEANYIQFQPRNYITAGAFVNYKYRVF